MVAFPRTRASVHLAVVADGRRRSAGALVARLRCAAKACLAVAIEGLRGPARAVVTALHSGLAGCLAVGALAACGGPGEPAVEAFAAGTWAPRAVRAYTVDGARDGDRTDVRVRYDLEDGARLHLDLRVFFNPRPVLEASRWRLETAAGDDLDGDVVAEELRFTGGQNEGPSLGGRFRLRAEDGVVRFRVEMPLRPVREPRWQVQ